VTAIIPSKIRALAHRRMALAALHANSSLSTRLKRYNHHMHQVRVLERVYGKMKETPVFTSAELIESRATPGAERRCAAHKLNGWP
jgi:hypothetical protein